MKERAYPLTDIVTACGFTAAFAAPTAMAALRTGLAAELLRGKWANLATAQALQRITAALQHPQFECYFDRLGRAVGTTLPTNDGAPDDAPTPATELTASRGWDEAIAQAVRPQPQAVAPPTLRSDLQGAKRESFTRSVEIGHALLALHRANHALLNLPLPRTLRRITHNLHLGQIDLHFAPSGECAGWMSWAWLSDAGLFTLRRRGPDALHPSQWDEGLQPCIIDIVIAEVLNPSTRSALLRDWLSHWETRAEGRCAQTSDGRPTLLLRYEDSPRAVVEALRAPASYTVPS